MPNADEGNLTVSGPSAMPAGEPFDVGLAWNVAAMEPWDRWYGAFDLGTSAGSPGNLGRTYVDLHGPVARFLLPLVRR